MPARWTRADDHAVEELEGRQPERKGPVLEDADLGSAGIREQGDLAAGQDEWERRGLTRGRPGCETGCGSKVSANGDGAGGIGPLAGEPKM